MSEKVNEGLGFWMQGRLAAWKKLEVRPSEGPHCPLTLELVEFACDELTDSDRIAQLNEHLKLCERCERHFKVQREAVEALRKANASGKMAPRVALGTALARRPAPIVLLGNVRWMKQAAQGANTTRSAELELKHPDNAVTLRGEMRRGEKRSPTGPSQWLEVSFQKPADPAEVDFWAELRYREVDLSFDSEDGQLLTIDEQLTFELTPAANDDDVLRAHVDITFDPTSIGSVRLKLGERSL